MICAIFAHVRRKGGKKHWISLPGLACLLLVAFAAQSFAGVDLTVFGPKRYDRLKGAPSVYTDTFERCNPSDQVLLRVTNGSGKATSVTAGTVSVNGTVVIAENEFKNQTALIEKLVTVRQSNELRVELKSGGPQTPFVIIEIIGKNCDSTPPVIVNHSPATGSLLNDPQPVVSASYSDEANGSGINTASIRLTLDGADVTPRSVVAATGISYSPPARLAEGLHTVSLALADRAANPASLTWQFTTDTIAPVPKVTSHADGQFVNTPVITLSGSVDDPSAVVTVNGTPAAVSGTTFSLGITLHDGGNPIAVIAKDAAGNIGTANLTIYLDTTPSTITILSPHPDDFVNTPTISVSGTVSEPVTALTVNGLPASVSGESFNLAAITLTEGPNVITVAARDRAGNPSSEGITVNLDTTPPVISVISPQPGSYLNTPRLTISGTVNEPVRSLKVNVASVPVVDNAFTSAAFTLTEGTNLIPVEAVDRAGNPAAVTVPLYLDTQPPVVQIAEPAADSFVNTPRITVSGTVNEPVTSVTVNGAPATVDGTGFTLAGVALTEGENTILVEARDRAGNSGSQQIKVTLDTVSPDVQVSQPAADSFINTPQVTVIGTVNEPVALVLVNGTGAAIDGQTFSLAGQALSEGQNLITATAKDRAGNEKTVIVPVTLDTQAPTVTITAPAAGFLTRSAQVTVSGEVSEEVASVTVNDIPAAVSGRNFTLAFTLAEGANILTVRAIDRAGNPGTASVTGTLDSTPPAAPVLSPLPSPTKTPVVTLLGTAEGNATVKVLSGTTLIGTVTADGQGSFTLAGVALTEGTNTFTASARDAAGNEGPASAPLDVVLDTQAPVLTVSTLPDGSYTNNATLNITGTVQDNVGLRDLQVNDTVVPVNADASFSYALVLTSGANTVTVVATDLAGNQASDTRTITLDQTAPVITVTTPADNSKTAQGLLTVSGSVDKAATVLVTLGGNAQPAALTGNAFSADLNLTSGTNTIEVTATDLAGNKSTVKRTVLFDDQMPSVAITDPNQDLRTNKSSVTIRGTASDPLTQVSVSIAVDGQTFTPPVVNGAFEQAVGFATEKIYAVVVTATNEVGTATSVQRNVIYDVTPPTIAIDPVTSPTNQGSQVVSGTMEAGAKVSVTCATATVGDVAYPTATTWRAPLTTFTADTNDIIATASDEAGNTAAASARILYDITGPTGSIAVSNGATVTNSGRVQLALNSTDGSGVTQMRFSADGTNWGDATAYGSATPWDLGAGDGTRTIYVQFRDGAGNWSVATSVTITLDTTPPVVTATPAGAIFRSAQSVTLAANEAATIYYTLDGSTPTENSTVYTQPLAIPASATLRFFAKDTAGNSSQPATESYTIDTVPPTVTITAPKEGLVTRNAKVTVTGTLSEENCTVRVNGAVATVTGTSFTLADYLLTEGTNTITVQASDRAGNPGSVGVTVTLDTTPPPVPTLTPLRTPTNVAGVTVSGTAWANSTVNIYGSGALIGTVSVDATGHFALPNVGLAEGTNSFTATALDAVGNESAPSPPVTVVLDTKPPVITVTAPAENRFFNTPQITVSGTVDEQVTAVTVNGSPAVVVWDSSTSTLTSSLTLSPGPNTITLVAKDQAGNAATTLVHVTLDTVAPTVTITAPVSGLVTNAATVTVSGSVSEDNTTATLNGAPLAVINQAFSAPFTLADGDNTLTIQATDRATNSGSASVTITLDARPPVVSLTAPATAAAGANVQIGVQSSDNRGVTLVEVRANGAPVWSATPGATASFSDGFSFRLPTDLAAGAGVDLQARAYDAAGNQGTALARIAVSQGASGPGYAQGKVFTDSRGLRLSGASVTVADASGATQNATTQADGGWFFQVPSGATLAIVSMTGYTTVERQLTVAPDQKSTAGDARLTPLAAGSVIGSSGGSAKAQLGGKPSLELAVPAGALVGDTEVVLTPVSNQGLVGLLPPGWSPLAVADVRLNLPNGGGPLADGSLVAPATLKATVPAQIALTPATVVTLATYDGAGHRWVAKGSASVAADGATISAAVASAGQYALVLPDPDPNPPAPAAAGEPLSGATLPQPSFDAMAAAGRVVPQAAPPSAGLKAAGEVVLTARADAQPAPVLTSGLLLTARVTERFNLVSGDSVQPDAYSQDIVLYRTPCVTNIGVGAVTPLAVSGAELRTTFPVSPSHDYTIVDLMTGKVGVAIVPKDTGSAGVMVGADGGRLLDSDGNVLVIPTGALSQSTPVTTRTIAPATAAGFVGADFTLVKGVEVDFTRQLLAQSATLSIPVPTGFDPTLPVVVAKRIDVKGVARLKLVAMARVSGAILTSDPTLPAPLVAPGITASGDYLFLQAKGAIGFLSGTVTDAGANPFNGALVATNTGSLVDLTTAAGTYLTALPVGAFSATATDIYKNDQGTGTGTIGAPNQAARLDLTIRMIPPQVTAITPADNAVNVLPSVAVVVTFTKALDRSTVTTSTLVLRDGTGNVVPGVLSFNVDGTVVTFYPAAAFQSETAYTVTVAGTIKDLQGYPLGQDVVSHFTIKKTTPPPMPAAGAITATFPDADGFITITATQGSAEPNDTVLLVNDTTGEIVSVTPLTDGSFTKKIRAQLGDEIKVVLMDRSGNQTVVSYITFRSDDGKYLVTAKGGTVEGEGGSLLDIPDGALVGPAVVKITPVLEADLPHPVPNGARFVGAVNIDSGGTNFQKEVHLSIPVPADLPAGATPFLAQPTEIANADGTVEQVYEIIDSTKIINGRITTASPPFYGVMTPGIFCVVYFDPASMLGGPVIISGTTYWDRDKQPGYTPGTDPVKSDRPIQGALIRAPGATNFVSFSKADGHYAVYGFTANGVCRGFPVTAIHPQTMNRVTANLMTCDAPYIVNNFNFRLADWDTVIPDKTPPAITMSLGVLPGQDANARIVAGTTPVGTKLNLPVRIIDQEMSTGHDNSVRLTVRYEDPASGGVTDDPIIYLTDPQLGSPTYLADQQVTLNRYDYQVKFDQGYFVPTQPGYYTFILDASDVAGNKSSRTIKLRAVQSGVDLGTGVDGPPRVDDVYPPDLTTGVPVTTSVIVTFNEPVQNVVAYSSQNQNPAATFFLYDASDPQNLVAIPSAVTLSIDGGLMRATLVPSGNLAYGRDYKVVVTRAVKDTEVNNSSPNKPPNGDGLFTMAQVFSSTFRTREPDGYDLPADQQSFSGRDIDLYTFTGSDGRESTYAYVMAGDKGWRVVDVTKTGEPTVIFSAKPDCDTTTHTDCRSVPLGFNYRSVAVHPDRGRALMVMTENITYADGNQYGYIRFYDLSQNPANPPVVGMERLAEGYTGIPGKVALYGDYAVISTTGAGVQIVNIKSAIKRMTGELPDYGAAIAGTLDTTQQYGSPVDVAVFNERSGVVTTMSGHLLSVDLNLPLDQRSIDENLPVFPMIANAYRPAGHTFFRVATAAGFTYNDADASVKTINLAVAYSTQGWLDTIDLTDPYNPDTLNDPRNHPGATTVQISGAVRDITVDKDAALVFVTTFASIRIYDIKDPVRPKLLNTISRLPSSSGVGNIDFANIQAIVEKDGVLYLASMAKGLVVLDVGLPQIVCVGGKGCDYDVERVYHLGQYETPDINPTSQDYYTDSYRLIDISVLKPGYVKVALLDRDAQEKSVVKNEHVTAGDYTFIIDYETVKGAGFDSRKLPEYAIQVTITPDDGSEPIKPKPYLGRISERIDGEMLGSTVVHDVLLQDGSLNLSRKDFAFKGRGPQLAFSRFYVNHPSSDVHKPLGTGWQHSLDLRLKAITGDDYVGTEALPRWVQDNKGKFFPPSVAENAKPTKFTRIIVNSTEFRKSGDAWVPNRGNHGKLTENPGSSFVFTAKDGTRYTYGYPDPQHNPVPVLTIMDTNGNNTMRFDYDSKTGRLMTVTDAVDRTCSFTYATLNICDPDPSRLMSVICLDGDQLGVQLDFHYNAKGYLAQVTRGDREESYTYAMEKGVKNGDYQLAKVEDGNGNAYGYDYFSKDGGDGFSTDLIAFYKILRPQNVIKSVTYPPHGAGQTPAQALFTYIATPAQNARTVTDLRGNDTTYTLNLFGNPTMIEEKAGKGANASVSRTTSMTWSIDSTDPTVTARYKNDNVMLSRTDGKQQTTYYEYDGQGNISKESVSSPTGALAGSIDTEWDQDFSLPTYRKDRNGRTQTWEYDPAVKGSLKTYTDGEGQKTTYENYPTGERKSMTSPRGPDYVTYYTYDAHGNPETVREPEGSLTQYHYDIRGRLADTTDPNGNQTLYTYDDLDYPASVSLPAHDASTHPLGGYNLPAGSSATKTTRYDTVGNLLSETDRTGLTLDYTYTPRNQVASIKRSGAGLPTLDTKTFGYDENGNLKSETDWKGVPTTHTYDALNRRDTTTNRNHDTMLMKYDLNDNLRFEQDYAGRGTWHDYDALNRLTKTKQDFILPGQTQKGELNYVYYNEADPKTNLKAEYDQEKDPTDPDGYLYYYEYNGRYQRTKRTAAKQADGSQKNHIWHYDPAGNLDVEVDEEGSTTTFDYDKQNRLTTVHLPGLVTLDGQALPPLVTHGYDAAGNRTSTTDARQNTTEMKYDEWNRLWKTISPAEHEKQYETVTELDGEGREVRSVDGRLVERTKLRDAAGRVKMATDGEHNPTSFEYDPNGNVLTMTEPNGTITTNHYDVEDRLKDSTEDGSASGTVPATRTREIPLRDKVGNPLQVKDFNGNITTTVYNALHLPERVCDPAPFDANCTVTIYRRNGQVKSVTDRRQKTTTYDYDELNRLRLVTDPLHQTVETLYDGVGNVTSVRDKRGIYTKNRYNALNLLVERTRQYTDTTYRLVTYDYDAAGNRTVEIDANGNRTEHTYTPRNLLETTTYPLTTPAASCTAATGQTTRSYTYDGVGNVETETDELRKLPTTYGYDGENRRTSVEFANETTTTKYTFFGKPLAITKPLGNGRVFAYDGFKRLVSVTEGGPVENGAIGDGLTTTYDYDANGNLRNQYGPDGDHTEYKYDALNRKTDHIQYLTGTPGNTTLPTSYDYDEEGNLKHVYDAKSQVITYDYDDINRLTDTTYEGDPSPYLTPTTTHTEYDGNNNVTRVVETKADQSGTPGFDVTDNVYNHLDRLESSVQRGVPISYLYDPNGNRTKVESPNGKTEYEYDERNLLKTATVDGTETTEYCYRPDGLKERVVYPNGTEIAYSYHDTKRVKGITNRLGTAAFSSYGYEYDKNGNRTRQVELQNGLTWTTIYGTVVDGQPQSGYDALDRLTGYSISTGTVTTQTDYTYDGYNRATEKVTDIVPKKTIVDGQEVITYETVVKNDKSYDYDSLNRLLSVTDSANPQQPHIVAYTYDVNGNTTKKTDTNLTPDHADTLFAYDILNRLVQAKQSDGGAGQMLGRYDYDADNLRIRHRNSDRGDVDYYYDGHSVIEELNAADSSLLARYSYADKLLGLVTQAGSQYYHHDALGSTVNLTDDAGSAQAGYVLSPFGQIVQQFGESVNRRIFTGKELDGNTGLVYFGARYYDPNSARFITEDRYLGTQDTPPSLHRYLYCYQQPTVLVDPDGNAPMTEKDFRAFSRITVDHEGTILFFYDDSKGNVTTGNGHKMENEFDAAKVPMLYRGTSKYASEVDKREEYLNILKRFDRALKAKDYEKYTTLVITKEAAVEMREEDVRRFAKEVSHELNKVGINLDNLPIPVQAALLDIGFNTGTGGLMKFNRMLTAVRKQDWKTAAKESHRKDVQESRNTITAKWFLDAASGKEEIEGLPKVEKKNRKYKRKNIIKEENLEAQNLERKREKMMLQ
jgi:RHS repeat-associated protein